MPRDWPPLAPADSIEWALRNDMQERGRRLRALAKATEGKVLTEVGPGIWRYETVLSNGQ